MSLDAIAQHARSIQEAYQLYQRLLSEGGDKQKLDGLQKYMRSLSATIKKVVDEERENVGN